MASLYYTPLICTLWVNRPNSQRYTVTEALMYEKNIPRSLKNCPKLTLRAIKFRLNNKTNKTSKELNKRKVYVAVLASNKETRARGRGWALPKCTTAATAPPLPVLRSDGMPGTLRIMAAEWRSDERERYRRSAHETHSRAYCWMLVGPVRTNQPPASLQAPGYKTLRMWQRTNPWLFISANGLVSKYEWIL